MPWKKDFTLSDEMSPSGIVWPAGKAAVSVVVDYSVPAGAEGIDEAAIAYARWGREYPSDFSGKYYREVPEEGLEPAVAGRLWRWNHDDMRDFTATVMRLAHKGVLRIEASDPSKDAAPTWYLSVAFGAPTGSLSALESSALEILMGHSALGDSRSLSQLKQRAID